LTSSGAVTAMIATASSPLNEMSGMSHSHPHRSWRYGQAPGGGEIFRRLLPRNENAGFAYRSDERQLRSAAAGSAKLLRFR
jgi:hypothetical protein